MNESEPTKQETILQQIREKIAREVSPTVKTYYIPNPKRSYSNRHFRRSVESQSRLPVGVKPISLDLKNYQNLEELKSEIYQKILHEFTSDDKEEADSETLYTIDFSPEKEIFINSLVQSLEIEPVEDGYFHQAQNFIEEGLDEFGYAASAWIQELYHDNLKTSPSLSADILKCVGRLDDKQASPWGFMMAVLGLSEPSIEIREAAVGALENWGTQEALEKLQDYVNREEIPWLKDYTNQVIRDITSPK